jgi:hypothetical protein
MAQVAHDPQVVVRIDDYLDYLIRTWEGVPLEVREWDEWDEFTRLSYDLDWGVPNERLAQLHSWSEQGLFNAAQHARFNQLLALVARYQPLLARILAEQP